MRHLTDKDDDGTTFGQSTTDEISFYGVTPIVQPSGAGQAAFAKTITTPAAQTLTTPAAQTAATVGTTTGAASPGYGYTTSTQAELILAHCNAATVDIGVLRTQIVNAVADITALRNQIVAANADIITLQTWQNKVRTDLVALGLQAGA